MKNNKHRRVSQKAGLCRFRESIQNCDPEPCAETGKHIFLWDSQNKELPISGAALMFFHEMYSNRLSFLFKFTKTPTNSSFYFVLWGKNVNRTNRFAFFSFTPGQEEPSYKWLQTKIRLKMPDIFRNFHCIRSDAKHTSVQRQRYNDVQTNCRAVHLEHQQLFDS